MTFVLTLSMSNYKLTKEVVVQQVGDSEKGTLLSNQLSQYFGTEFTYKFSFIEELKAAIDRTNTEIESKYGILEEEVASLVSIQNFPGKFQLSSLDNTTLSAEKKNSLSSYIGWMNERDYQDVASFKNDIQNAVNDINNNLANTKGINAYEKGGIVFNLTKASSVGFLIDYLRLLMFISFVLTCVGGILYTLPNFKGPAGIKNNGIYQNQATSKGALGIVVGIGLILFYCMLYWAPEYITNWVILVDPISMALSGNPAGQWFLYGFMYCLSMVVMGVRMFSKYRHNKYQLVRTASVVFFQLAFAFLIPEILVRMNQPYFDFKNMWPLDYDFFFDWNLATHLNSGTLGVFMLVWGISLFVIGVPVFVFFFGKRWYCSWVCGCGGLAETLGDPFRQLSDKSTKAWKIERYLIHSVLVFAVFMTGLTLYTYFSGSWTVFGIQTASVQKTYGFMIGSIFSGVVGTGFYPLMGNRVWCRFGCPLAAYLGIVQRFKSRFRITTNGGQCISCGNCSTYCEMGIDVRAYAQKGQNIVRSSCVGCGVCSAVCPRGVLKLENGPEAGRIKEEVDLLGMEDVRLIDRVN